MDYEFCDLEPWLAEIIVRMHEARAVNSVVVNLSFTHPRGYIPTAIIRRPRVQQILAGWGYDNTRMPPEPYPEGHYWLPKAGLNLDYCPTEPFEQEIELRLLEARAAAEQYEAQYGVKVILSADLTCHHPRGGIPSVILDRLERRQDKDWLKEMEEEIKVLQGEANRAEAFAETQKSRAEGIASKGGDPTPLLSAAQEQIQRAAQYRQQVQLIKNEMGAAA